MPKGKGAGRKKSGPPKERKFDGGGSRVNAAERWEDMEHDSEDEYVDGRGKILLDHENSRRPEMDEGSEEDVFGLDDEEEEEEDDEDENADSDAAKESEEEDIDKASWGKHKRSYYNAEDVESDEETAKAEEEEALRLQKKRLAAMSEEHFAPAEEEDVWGASVSRGILGDQEADKALVAGFDQELAGIQLGATKPSKVVVEKIAKAGIQKLSKKEILQVLQNESPELLDLVEEFKEKMEALHAVAEVLEMVRQLPKPLKETRSPLPFLRLKYQTVINYLTNIAFYITLKSSPDTTAQNAASLRDHPVIDALVELRTSLGKLEKMEEKKAMRRDMEELLEILEDGGEADSEDEVGATEGDSAEDQDDDALSKAIAELEALQKSRKAKKETTAKKAKKTDKTGEFEYNVDLEDDFVSHSKPSKKAKKSIATNEGKKRSRNVDDDFGDLDELLDIDAEDKIQKKKSLRDYVSKVDQAVNKRSKILRGSGDTDIPYRERFKDRQEQIKRQQVKSAPAPENADLDDLDWDAKDLADARKAGRGGDDGDSGSDDGGYRGHGGTGNGEGDDDYYEQVVQDKAAKKAARKALNDNIETTSSFEDTTLADPNDKRSISWQILKNKGLTPHRKKEQRNPRVKHRNKYETAKKKIKSVKRVFTRLEGSYGGEKTGIKTGLARSVKFS